MKVGTKRLRGLSTALCLLSGAALAQSVSVGQGQTSESTPQAAADSTPATRAATPAIVPRKSDPAVAASQNVGEILVTATRRASSVQKVTATIDVASATKLEALNIKEPAGLETVVPGVTVARSGGVTPFIRGIGTFNAGFSEASVGAYIDGIYLPNSSGVLFSFNNIERVEVLKGPQGTLYGRNTTGGLINIITKQPDDSPAADVSLGYASYNTLSGSVYASGPLADKVAANIAVYHSKQGTGWTKNVFTGSDIQKSDETGVYGKLQWQPAKDTKVTFSGLFNRSDSNKGWAFAITPGNRGADGTPYLGEYKISNRTDPFALFEGSMASLKIDQSFDFADVFSLTGYQYGKQSSYLSQNGIPGNPVAGQGSSNVNIDFNYHTFSQEFQLSSKASDSPFEWIAGAFYYRDNTDVTTSLTATCVGSVCSPLPGNLPPTYVNTRPTTKSVSAYGDGTYKFTKATRLTIGLRYTDEDKGFSGSVTPRSGFPNSVTVLPASVVLTPVAAGVPASVNASKLTYRAVIAHDFTSSITGYVSHNLGFKSGNYNPNSVTNPPVRPELLEATEVGLKSELLDRKLRLNLSAFHYDYTDIQVRSNAGLPPGSVSVALNVASARTNGFEAQIDYKPVPGLSLSGGFAYLDAKYASYPGATCTTPRALTATVLGGLIGATCNLAGFPLPLSPKYSAALGFSYEIPTSIGPITWVANNSYKSRFTFTPDNTVQQGPINVIDTSIKWKSHDAKYDVQLFVKNATDKYRYVAGQAGSAYVYVPGEPRTFGLVIGYHM